MSNLERHEGYVISNRKNETEIRRILVQTVTDSNEDNEESLFMAQYTEFIVGLDVEPVIRRTTPVYGKREMIISNIDLARRIKERRNLELRSQAWWAKHARDRVVSLRAEKMMIPSFCYGFSLPYFWLLSRVSRVRHEDLPLLADVEFTKEDLSTKRDGRPATIDLGENYFKFRGILPKPAREEVIIKVNSNISDLDLFDLDVTKGTGCTAVDMPFQSELEYRRQESSYITR
jgi:hypothetical protein